MLLFIIISSLNSLLSTRALCGCMDNPLVLKPRSTDAEVTGTQKIFSNSSCKSALHKMHQRYCNNQNSFFYLTCSQSSLSSSSRFTCIVIVILCLQNADSAKIQGLKSLGTLPLSLLHIVLRDIWRRPNVFRRLRLCYSVASVVCRRRLSVRNVLWLNGAS